MILKTEAIVLKSLDFRETSRIVTFFTKEHGRVTGILKGIRKDPRKFGSSVERFSVNDIVYYQYRNSDLHLVSQCDLKEFYFPIRQDLKRSLAASYILELIYRIMPSEEPNLKVYHLMKDFLVSLQDAPDINRLIHSFQIKTLLHSGFRPHLDSCVRCRKKIEGKARFSMRDGGLMCMACPLLDTTVHFVSPAAISSILYIERESWEHCLRLHLEEPVVKELKYVLNNFLIFHLGRKIKSAQYLG